MTKRIARDPSYRGRRFSAETIELCVRWYITYRLSYRDLAAMMAERGNAAGGVGIGMRAYTAIFPGGAEIHFDYGYYRDRHLTVMQRLYGYVGGCRHPTGEIRPFTVALRSTWSMRRLSPPRPAGITSASSTTFPISRRPAPSRS